MEYRYFIHLAYDGSEFHGWQLQSHVRTVQGVINEAISKVLRREVNLVGCGRTDTGVHASDFYAHFDHDELLEHEALDQLAFKLNKMLGREIAIYSIFRVKEKAHTRFGAVSRTYHYRITRKKNPFEASYAWYLYGPLDIQKMNEACEILKEYEDFECFSKVNTQVNTFICHIEKAEWWEENDLLVFEIKADRFLRNMVRAIVGTMLEIGTGKYEVEDLHQIIRSKNRSEAGFSVPAKGLFLTSVDYPSDIRG